MAFLDSKIRPTRKTGPLPTSLQTTPHPTVHWILTQSERSRGSFAPLHADASEWNEDPIEDFGATLGTTTTQEVVENVDDMQDDWTGPQDSEDVTALEAPSTSVQQYFHQLPIDERDQIIHEFREQFQTLLHPNSPPPPALPGEEDLPTEEQLHYYNQALGELIANVSFNNASNQAVDATDNMQQSNEIDEVIGSAGDEGFDEADEDDEDVGGFQGGLFPTMMGPEKDSQASDSENDDDGTNSKKTEAKWWELHAQLSADGNGKTERKFYVPRNWMIEENEAMAAILEAPGPATMTSTTSPSMSSSSSSSTLGSPQSKSSTPISLKSLRRLILHSLPSHATLLNVPWKSVWKASYVCAEKDQQRTRIVPDDLFDKKWAYLPGWMDGTGLVKFRRDGTRWCSMWGPPLRWAILGNGGVQVDRYPPYETRRTRDWGWVLTNSWCEYRTLPYRSGK
ncbi:hypothetical protein HDU97_003228 [Phlyctochytrium planicorne]|nr:hypothetical protein HDU97_003228 [Phlyctochytrium planicorne]